MPGSAPRSRARGVQRHRSAEHRFHLFLCDPADAQDRDVGGVPSPSSRRWSTPRPPCTRRRRAPRRRRRRARRAPRRPWSGSRVRTGSPTARRCRRGQRRRRCRERAEQRERDRLVGDAQPDGVEAAGDLVGHVREHASTTTVSGPGQNAAASASASSDTRDDHASIASAVGEVHDHRVVRRASLHREQAAQRVGRRRVGAEAVHRLGRERPPDRRRAARRPRLRSQHL